MERTKKQKMEDLILLIIFLAVFGAIFLWGQMSCSRTLDEMEKPYLIQVDFDGDSSWDVSFLADSYDPDGNQLLMRFGDERYSIEYSSFLATRLDIARNDHEPGPLSDAQAEKLLELSKNKEGSEW